MSERMECRLDLPRWQVWTTWVSFVAWEVVAVLGLRVDWLRGPLGATAWLTFLTRSLQGVILAWVGFGLQATLLDVEDGRLRVRTRWHRLLRRVAFETPLVDVSLEWIGGRLLLQRPQEGLMIQLGAGPSAHRVADWLVARGVRPPVGG